MKRILIVDDNDTLRQRIRKALERRGIDVFESTDGDDAVQLALIEQPDAVLLDYSMPGITGLEAASLIHKKLPSTPIVLLTLYAEIISPELAKAVGIVAIVSKFENLKDLVAVVLGSINADQTDLEAVGLELIKPKNL